MRSRSPKHHMTGFNLIPTHQMGEPNFDKVYNPVIWGSLSHHPVCSSGAKGSQYKANCLPAGCHPVLPNEDVAGIITHGGPETS